MDGSEHRPTLARLKLRLGIFALTFVVVLGLVAPPTLAAGAPASTLVSGVESVGMTVSNMDRAIDFYTNVLSFQKLSDTEVAGESYEQLQGVFGLRMRIVRLQLGDEIVELTQYLTPRGRPVPIDSRSNDRWFQHVAIIVRDMDEAYAWLRANNVEFASTEPQRIPDWNVGAAGIRAFYFHDPDEHTLEVLAFPSDKGLPQWQQKDRLFLGIDHTAIVVGDSGASLRFYRDLLGFQVVGGGENYGTEQEHLNNVAGAHLRITTLRGVSGPAIELLEYLTPNDGRPIPNDLHANDLAFWQTRLLAANADDAVGRLHAEGVPFVSPGLIALPAEALGFNTGALVRDPDGHAMEIVGR